MNLTNVILNKRNRVKHTLNPFILKLKNRQSKYLFVKTKNKTHIFMNAWLHGKNVKKTSDYHKTEGKDDK